MNHFERFHTYEHDLLSAPTDVFQLHTAFQFKRVAPSDLGEHITNGI